MIKAVMYNTKHNLFQRMQAYMVQDGMDSEMYIS